MAVALYPGSFDPFHNGHLAVVEQASRLFDRVVITVLVNPKKQPFMAVGDRIAAIAAATAHLSGVEVAVGEGLTVDAARHAGATVIVRSYAKEFLNEMQMAATNASAGIPSCFIAAHGPTKDLSSTLVRRFLDAGDVAAVRHSVPAAVADALANRLEAVQA